MLLWKEAKSPMATIIFRREIDTRGQRWYAWLQGDNGSFVMEDKVMESIKRFTGEIRLSGVERG